MTIKHSQGACHPLQCSQCWFDWSGKYSLPFFLGHESILPALARPLCLHCTCICSDSNEGLPAPLAPGR